MANKKVITVNEKMLSALSLIILGIIFILSIVLNLNLISIILGVGFIVTGAIFVLIKAFSLQPIISPFGIVGGFLIAFGIFFISVNLFNTLTKIIPFLAIVFGSLIIMEAIFARLVRKTMGKTLFILLLIFGIIILTVGILMLTINKFFEFAGLVLGIVLLVGGIYLLIKALPKREKK